MFPTPFLKVSPTPKQKGMEEEALPHQRSFTPCLIVSVTYGPYSGGQRQYSNSKNGKQHFT
jgi:hypothetical protein